MAEYTQTNKQNSNINVENLEVKKIRSLLVLLVKKTILTRMYLEINQQYVRWGEGSEIF